MQLVPALEKRLSRRTSQQLPQWQTGRSTVQASTVGLTMQRTGSVEPQQAAPLPQPSRRTSKLQSAASGTEQSCSAGSGQDHISHRHCVPSGGDEEGELYMNFESFCEVDKSENEGQQVGLPRSCKLGAWSPIAAALHTS